MHVIEKGGMASMVPQKQLIIPAEGELKMSPGGYHLMLYTSSNKLKAGDSVSFTLKFANGSKTIVNAKVKKASSKGGHQHHQNHSQHSDHDKHRRDDEQKDHQMHEMTDKEHKKHEEHQHNH